MRIVVALPWLIVSILRAAPPSTSPSTVPATDTLLGGKVTYIPPPGWDLRGKLDGGRTAAYLLEPDKASLAITVNEQDVALDAAAALKMGQFICKKLREDVPRSGAEIHTPPRVEKDDRFFLKVRDRFTRDGRLADRLQIYRVIGLELITVAVTAYSDSPEDVKVIHEEAEQLLLSAAAPGRNAAAKPQAARARGAAAAKPMVLSQARIRITPPSAWRAELTDSAAGIVATFRQEADETNLIALSVRPLPKDARTDPKLRDIIVEEMVAGEKQQFKIEGAEVKGSTETIKDNRFLRKTRTRYQAKDREFQVGSRQLRVGNTLVSVSTVSLIEQSDGVEKLADDLAVGIRSTGAP